MLIEYVNGKTLDAVPIPHDQLIVVFAQMAAGLAHMHRRGSFMPTSSRTMCFTASAAR